MEKHELQWQNARWGSDLTLTRTLTLNLTLTLTLTNICTRSTPHPSHSLKKRRSLLNSAEYPSSNHPWGSWSSKRGWERKNYTQFNLSRSKAVIPFKGGGVQRVYGIAQGNPILILEETSLDHTVCIVKSEQKWSGQKMWGKGKGFALDNWTSITLIEWCCVIII